jgi:hypothetical protein
VGGGIYQTLIRPFLPAWHKARSRQDNFATPK